MGSLQNGFEVLAEKLGCCGALWLRGELDLAGVPAFTARIEGLASGGTRHLLVDCEELTFIDSAGLAVLVSAHQLFHGNMALIRLGPSGEKLLEIAGLVHMFPAFETVDQAQIYLHDGAEAVRLTAKG